MSLKAISYQKYPIKNILSKISYQTYQKYPIKYPIKNILSKISYQSDSKNAFHRLKLNVVICDESWTEDHSRSTGKIEECSTRYAWLSSTPLNQSNVFYRCTKMGRYRWNIENDILTEKHQGYSYEHCYSYTWKVMEGYHYLMKIGHFLNVMVINSELLNGQVKELGIQGFFQKLWKICSYADYLELTRILSAANSVKQWRLQPAC